MELIETCIAIRESAGQGNALRSAYAHQLANHAEAIIQLQTERDALRGLLLQAAETDDWSTLYTLAAEARAMMAAAAE